MFTVRLTQFFRRRRTRSLAWYSIFGVGKLHDEYGVVIETADGEYKYTANANTKKNETDTAIQYAVVVTGGKQYKVEEGNTIFVEKIREQVQNIE